MFDMTPRAPGATPHRLLSREHLPVVVGIIALVTLAAFENRAVMAILPTVVGELDGWALFGASAGAPLITLTLATVYAGSWTDRVGPRHVLLAGLGAFVLAQLVCALAPSMSIFVVGRAASGAAEALIDTTLMVLVARVLPADLRAKVFASFSAAWILPSLLGPSLAGLVDGLLGWRWVFAGPLLIVPLALVLLRDSLARAEALQDAPEPDGVGEPQGAPLGVAIVLAAGLTAMTFSGPLVERPGGQRLLGLTLVGLGLLLIALTSSRVLPAGALRLARGIPSLVTLRLLVAAGFTAVGGLIPLMLVQTQGVSTAVAGISLSVTGTLWAAGSFLNSLATVQQRWADHQRLRVGFLCIAVGAAGPILIALGVFGLVPGLLGWALSALGMGIVSPTLSTALLGLAPVGEQGRVSASQGVALSTGVALQTGLVGTVIALSGASTTGTTFAALMLGGAAVAALGALAAPRARP
ncbi:MAG: MFS transporter [Nostocoides sp.]